MWIFNYMGVSAPPPMLFKGQLYTYDTSILVNTPESKVYIKLKFSLSKKNARPSLGHSAWPSFPDEGSKAPPELFQLFTGSARTGIWFSRLSGQSSYTKQPPKQCKITVF